MRRGSVATCLLGLFVLLVAHHEMGAQQISLPSPELAGIAHVAIRVRDLDASVAFYEKLGFVKAFALSRDSKVYEAFIKINDQQFLELYPVDEKNPEAGFLHVCFYGKDLRSVHGFYVQHGLTPKDVRTAGAGNLLFTMPGPETPTGPQNMEYTEYMPESMHSKAVGQFLGPDRISRQLIEVGIAFTNPADASAFYKDKVAFIPIKSRIPEPGSVTLFGVPGNASEMVRLLPVFQLGARARITLAADAGAAAMLSKRGVPFMHGTREIDPRDLVVVDPDGNQVVLH